MADPDEEDNKSVRKTTGKEVIDTLNLMQSANIPLSYPIDENMVSKGTAIYRAKCAGCHKLTVETLVGPGLKGITNRRSAQWIMTFITSSKISLEAGAKTQNEIETCIMHIPKQTLKFMEARNVLEMMRKNDVSN